MIDQKNKKLPKFVLEAIKKCGLSNPMLIDVRKKGISARGVENYCHGNVANMVGRYGGKRSSGFAIIPHPEIDDYQFIYHSVWVTPEGKRVCISKSNYANNPNIDNYLWFIELEVKSINLNVINLYNELHVTRSAIELYSIECDEWVKVNYRRAKFELSKSVLSHKFDPERINFLKGISI